MNANFKSDELEITKNFFNNARKSFRENGDQFFLIKSWDANNIKRADEENYQIELSFHIVSSQKEQLNLNRFKKSTGRQPGVEIPIKIAPALANLMLKQIGNNAYQKGTCKGEDIEKIGTYTFERIDAFLITLNSAINFKLMYNSKETKYFINRQKGLKGYQRGVEIPIQMLEQIARYLIGCSRIINKKQSK